VDKAAKKEGREEERKERKNRYRGLLMFIFIILALSCQPDVCAIVTRAGYKPYNTCHSDNENK
jgi:hypothetical protein